VIGVATDWQGLIERLRRLEGQEVLVSVHARDAPMVASLSGRLVAVSEPIRKPGRGVPEMVYAELESPIGFQFTGFTVQRRYLTHWRWDDHDREATPEDDPGPMLTVAMGSTQLQVQPADSL
jgi:hypothetical protein